MRLDEYKNVSDKVYNFSHFLYRKIIEESSKTQKMKSKINQCIFTENSFTLSKTNTPNWIFENIDTLSVAYVLYFTNSLEAYNYLVRTVGSDANSEADYEARTLKIVSGYIGGYPSPDFLSTICHEVNHLFEYDKGREIQVGLYEKVKEMLTDEDENRQIVAKALYYTFAHERDAFVHQFYGFLCQEKPLHLSFEELLKYSEYKNAKIFCNHCLVRKIAVSRTSPVRF